MGCYRRCGTLTPSHDTKEHRLVQLHVAKADQFESSVLRQLSTLDRFLPVWIGLAMAVGLGLGRAFPDLNDQLDRVKVDQTSLPIAIGLLGMMYPVLAKVRYDRQIGRASCRERV